MGQGSSTSSTPGQTSSTSKNTSVTSVSKNNSSVVVNSKNGNKEVVTVPSPSAGGKRKNKNHMNGGVASVQFQTGTQPSEAVMQRATTANMAGGKRRTMKHRSHKHKAHKGKKSKHHSKKH